MNRLLAEAAPLDNRLLSTDEEDYDRLARHVTDLFEKQTDLSNANLDTIDPSTQTIPFLYVLAAQIEASLNSGKAAARLLPASVLPEGLLWPDIARLLLQFDPIQVRYAGRQFTKVVEVVAKGAEQSQNAVPAIQLLANAIVRLDPTSSTLTTTHYHYVRLCLLARAYGDATAILDLPISFIPSQDISRQIGPRAYKYLCSVHDSSSVYLTPTTGLTQKITSRIYLEYFLMGAMCYMAQGEFEKAQFFCEAVLVAPTVQTVASAVMIEAYKKWLLLNLILHGTEQSTGLPKTMSPSAIRIIRPLAKPYECIVEAFRSNKLDRLHAEIQEGNDIWQGDGNYGLMHEVIMAFRKFSIVRLGKVYAALAIEDVAKQIYPQVSAEQEKNALSETLVYIQSLINTGQLQAETVPSSTALPQSSSGSSSQPSTTTTTASTSIGTLRFSTTASSSTTIRLSESEVEAYLAVRTQELQLLMRQISDYDHQLAISKDYIDWLQKLKGARDKEKRDLGGGGGVGGGLAGAGHAGSIGGATGVGIGGVPGMGGMDMHDEDMMDDT